MTNKFFSIFFLTASMVVSVLSAAPLRVINGSAGEVSHVSVAFSYGNFDSQDTINVTNLQANQTGTTDFSDKVKSIKLYTVTYIDANGTQVTENFHGKVFYLPADLTLGNAPVSSVAITQNDEARKIAEEAEFLNQIAAKAKNAKNQVIQSATAAKDWIIGTTKAVTDQVKVATQTKHATQEVVNTAEEIIS